MWQERRSLRHTEDDLVTGKMRHSNRAWGDDPTRTFDGQHQKHMAGQWCQQCGAWRGELGNEETPEAFVEHLVEVFREVRRVLRPDGLAFCNLGDSFYNCSPVRQKSSDGFNDAWDPGQAKTRGGLRRYPKANQPWGLKMKDLVGMPWRFAFAMQADGWILRNAVVWHKTNCKPESVRDRFTMDYEMIFMFARSPKYYFDPEAVREPHRTTDEDRKRHRRLDTRKQGSAVASGAHGQPHRDSHGGLGFASGGRNRRSVWSISTKSFRGAHFAVFAPEIPEICLRSATSEGGCCSKCGTPRVRVTVKGEPDREWQAACGGDAEGQYDGQATKDYAAAGAENASEVKARILEGMRPKITLGWAFQCKCYGEWNQRTIFPRTKDAKRRRHQDVTGSFRQRVARYLNVYSGYIKPCRVLDPFCGSGTTLEVAHKLGLDGVGIELQDTYVPLAQERVAKAGGVLEVDQELPEISALVAAAAQCPRFLCELEWEPGEPIDEGSGWIEDACMSAFTWAQ